MAVLVTAGVLIGLLLARSGGRRAAVAAATAGTASAALTGYGWWARPFGEADRLAGLAGMVELLALLGLVTIAARAERPGPAALAGAAAAFWPLRFVHQPGSWQNLELLGFGTGAAALAAVVGRYLAGLDQRRHREVAATRRDQRLELAHDLHDFVAHDVSGMVALAQAGAIVAQASPEQAAAVFARIEQAGRQALASLDRTVTLLRTEQPGPARGPQPGLADLRELTDRFTAAGPATAQLRLPAGPVDREAGATAYRIVAEALTNVRRHAPTARRVAVALEPVAAGLAVRVTDDGRAAAGRPGPRPGGGSGLAALAARVEALGGSFTAGRTAQGWQVSAVLPHGGAR
ncbi:hypothetical protein GCM10009738_38610 [Kitasatospora viridis]